MPILLPSCSSLINKPAQGLDKAKGMLRKQQMDNSKMAIPVPHANKTKRISRLLRKPITDNCTDR
jgi:hypothetical protein